MRQTVINNLFLVEGNIAAGKSTVLTKLQQEFDCICIQEPTLNNPLLEQFYANPKANAQKFQLWFLHKRYDMYQNACEVAANNPDKKVFLDRSVFSDCVFAMNCLSQNLMTQQEYDEYYNQYNQLSDSVSLPQKVFYLDVKPETCLFRIREVRKTQCEKWIELGYLRGLDAAYLQFVKAMRLRGVEVRMLDWSRFGEASELL